MQLNLKEYFEQFLFNLSSNESEIDFFGLKINSNTWNNPKKLQQFARLLHCTEWIMRLEKENINATKRDIYYTNVSLYDGKQVNFEKTLQKIISSVPINTEHLHLMSSAKGLIHGNLIIELHNGSTIDCSKGNGVIIPCNELVKNIHCQNLLDTAILVVEKDSIFQILLQHAEQISTQGKGFPCRSTSYIVHLLGKNYVDMRQFAIVDLDPSGICIYKTYKYGSKMIFSSPNLSYLGLKYSDLENYAHFFSTNPIEFTKRDESVCKSLAKNEDLVQDENVKLSLEFILNRKQKYEIEAIYQNQPTTNLVSFIVGELNRFYGSSKAEKYAP